MEPRELVAADLERVAAIEQAAFTDPWLRRSFEELLAEPHVRCLAVDDDGTLAGYAICSLVAGEGEILNLAVDPAAQRRGLGRRLLEAALDLMRDAGIAAVFLEVRQSNRAAIQLYRSAGFQPISVRRSYYRNPVEHALTMTLELAPGAARKR